MTTIGSLFSGIGGLETGLEWALNARTIWQVEIEEFPRRVLAKHWPDADRSVRDVRKANAKTLPPVDLICGGFPCQDLSPAGNRVGLSGARSGLAFEFLRLVEDIKPRCVVFENTGNEWAAWVPELRRYLFGVGYASLPLRVRACEAGAPHLRSRVFLIAWRMDANRAGIGNPTRLARVSQHREPAEEPRISADAVRGVDDGVPRRLDQGRIKALGNSVVPGAGAIVGVAIDKLGILN